MEAIGHARWFERLLAELNFELWVGDAAEIRTKRVRKAKTDRQDAQLLLRLLLEDRFPRIWILSWENRDLRQLLWHRHRMVQARTRIMNQLQAVALNEGLRYKKRLWREAGRKQRESMRSIPEWHSKSFSGHPDIFYPPNSASLRPKGSFATPTRYFPNYPAKILNCSNCSASIDLYSHPP